MGDKHAVGGLQTPSATSARGLLIVDTVYMLWTGRDNG